MPKQVSPKIVALTFGVLAICFLAAFYVVAWQEPTEAPPGGNVAAPLNVSSVGQIKTGNLVINALGISGSGGPLFSMPVGAGVGKVLTSDASGSGSWQAPPTGSSVLVNYGTYSCDPYRCTNSASPCPTGWTEAGVGWQPSYEFAGERTSWAIYVSSRSYRAYRTCFRCP